MNLEIKIHDDKDLLTSAAAADIATAIAGALELKERASIVLTGGTLGIQILKDLSALQLPVASLDVFWGDERFVGLEDPDRNEHQALEAWPELLQANLFRFPSIDQSLESASTQMNKLIEGHFGAIEQTESVFDVLILGMGPDGHVASLFPGHTQENSWVIAEPNSPKPPLQRLSFSFSALNRASNVFFLASGESKASAVGCALEDPNCDLPAAKVSGQSTTTWYLDKELSRAL